MEHVQKNYGLSFVSLFSFTIFLLTSATATNPPDPAFKLCDFPAIFNFGASNSDTGGLAAAFVPLKPPYGETFFHMPAGRYSDGRLIIDFIAESLELPYLNAYLNSLRANFKHGANFATAGSTIRLPDQVIPKPGGFSPFFLEVQYLQFLQFINRTQFIREQGGVFAKLMPKKEYFGKALYTFDIGQNDLAAGFVGNKSVQQVNASIPDIVTTFSLNIKRLYGLGARSFWIHNTGPIGCLPSLNSNLPSETERDSAGCAKLYNEVAQYFNYMLKQRVDQLRIELPFAALIYVDIYSPKYSLFTEPKTHGFELPLVSCCGYGGRYNYSSAAQCGATITVNGTQMVVGSCDRPSSRVIWDGTHYTEAANRFVFDQIVTGAFTDPPIPLKMACNK